MNGIHVRHVQLADFHAMHPFQRGNAKIGRDHPRTFCGRALDGGPSDALCRSCRKDGFSFESLLVQFRFRFWEGKLDQPVQSSCTSG